MFGSWRKELEHKLDLIYTALVVRDPGTSMAAEAYEGLRKQVIAGATARQAHVAQLAEIDVALRRGASTEDLARLTSQWLDQAGVVRVEDASRLEAFESTVAPGVPVEVETPAYVNTVTGQLVRQGRLRERATPVLERAPHDEESGQVTTSSLKNQPSPVDPPPSEPTKDDGEAPRADAPVAANPEDVVDTSDASEDK